MHKILKMRGISIISTQGKVFPLRQPQVLLNKSSALNFLPSSVSKNVQLIPKKQLPNLFKKPDPVQRAGQTNKSIEIKKNNSNGTTAKTYATMPQENKNIVGKKVGTQLNNMQRTQSLPVIINPRASNGVNMFNCGLICLLIK